MQFRFRYMDAGSVEVEVGSVEDLRRLVREGEVDEPTLLFDALTREWAPARAHAVYRLLREELEAERGAGEASAQAPLPDLELDVGLDVSFQPPPEIEDAEESVRALLREREREEDGGARMGGFAPLKDWVPDPTPASPAASARGDRQGEGDPVGSPDSEPTAAPSGARVAAPDASVAADVAPRATPAPADPARAGKLVTDPVQDWLVRMIDRAQELLGHRALPPTLVAFGVLGLLLLLFAVLREDGAAGSPSGGQRAAAAAAPAPGPDVSGMVERLALAQASGFQTMVAGMDSLRRVHDVVTVPPIWLEGRYLAHASQYPEVRAFWERYGTYLSEVRARDTALYRAGFVDRLENDGVSGAVLSMRLARALREFGESQPARASVYLHMEELASAALELHDLLVDRESDIAYDPALQGGVSRDPVVEAVPLDSLLRDHMWVLLERIFASLEHLGGELGGSRDNVTEVLLQGMEASR